MVVSIVGLTVASLEGCGLAVFPREKVPAALAEALNTPKAGIPAFLAPSERGWHCILDELFASHQKMKQH